MHLAVALAALAAAPAAADQLVQVVVSSRHGVRAPYGPNDGPPTPENLAPYSPYPFPTMAEWGVDEEALLTPHGALAVTKMGGYYAELYGGDIEGLSCDAVQHSVYADNCQRDNLTALSFFDGFLPGCEVFLINDDLLFNQGGTTSAECPLASEDLVGGTIGGADAQALTSNFFEEISAMQDLLQCCSPSVCNGTDPCTLFDIPFAYVGSFWETFDGSFSSAAYFSEYFLLQMLNNMTYAWDNSTEAEVMWLSGLETQSLATAENYWNARSFGSFYGAHITAQMEQVVSGEPVQGLANAASPFVYYAGHDVNNLYLRQLLRLNWVALGWVENEASLGGMVTFELWRNDTAGAEHYVRAFFDAATPSQIRAAEDLSTANPPSRSPLSIPGCETVGADLACPYSEFRYALLEATDPNCMPDSLEEFYAAVVDTGVTGGGSDSDDGTTVSLGVFLGTLAAVAVVAAGVTFFSTRAYMAKVQPSASGSYAALGNPDA